jgi:hypothetical protein
LPDRLCGGGLGETTLRWRRAAIRRPMASVDSALLTQTCDSTQEQSLFVRWRRLASSLYAPVEASLLRRSRAIMRKIVVIAAAGLVLALGALDAHAMGGEGGPSDAWGSPYALLAPQSFRPPPSWTWYYGGAEGRAAAVGENRPLGREGGAYHHRAKRPYGAYPH